MSGPVCRFCKGAGIVYRYAQDQYGPPALHPRTCLCRFEWGHDLAFNPPAPMPDNPPPRPVASPHGAFWPDARHGVGQTGDT